MILWENITWYHGIIFKELQRSVSTQPQLSQISEQYSNRNWSRKASYAAKIIMVGIGLWWLPKLTGEKF